MIRSGARLVPADVLEAQPAVGRLGNDRGEDALTVDEGHREREAAIGCRCSSPAGSLSRSVVETFTFATGLPASSTTLPERVVWGRVSLSPTRAAIQDQQAEQGER